MAFFHSSLKEVDGSIFTVHKHFTLFFFPLGLVPFDSITFLHVCVYLCMHDGKPWSVRNPFAEPSKIKKTRGFRCRALFNAKSIMMSRHAVVGIYPKHSIPSISSFYARLMGGEVAGALSATC